MGLEATGARLQPSHPAQGLGLHSSFSCYTYPVWEKLFLAGFFVLGRGGVAFKNICLTPSPFPPCLHE